MNYSEGHKCHPGKFSDQTITSQLAHHSNRSFSLRVNKLFLIRNRTFFMEKTLILHKMDNKSIVWHEVHIFTCIQPKQQYLFRQIKQNNVQEAQLRLG